MSEAAAAPEPDAPPRFMSRWLVWALGLGLGAVGGWWVVAVASEGAQGAVEGKVEGPVEQIYLVELDRGVFQEGTLRDDGSYRPPVPAGSAFPQVVAHGPLGSMVRTGGLNVQDGGVVRAPDLRLWTSELRIRRRDLEVRFDWKPIPAGQPGYPEARLKDSLLIIYPKADGEQGQASLISFDPWMEIGLPTLAEYMPDRATDSDALELELRAYDSGQEDGATWIGTRVAWRAGEETVTPLGR